MLHITNLSDEHFKTRSKLLFLLRLIIYVSHYDLLERI